MLKIIGPRGYGDNPYNSHGTSVELDGVPVKELCDVTLRFPVDGALTCDFSVFVTGDFEFETNDARINITMLVPEGQLVDVTTHSSPPGVRRYRAVASERKE